MTSEIMMFIAKNLKEDEVKGKRILEVGSKDVNGSIRPIVNLLKPSKYIGVDVEKGSGVDRVCNAENIVKIFGENSFDVVLSTELIEHVPDWKIVITNIKRCCKTGGIIFLTTRSKGHIFHGYPYDFWRWEPNDMRTLFKNDCSIKKIASDLWYQPGVFVKAIKTSPPYSLNGYQLYNILFNKKMSEMPHGFVGSRKFHLMVHAAKIRTRAERFITRISHKVTTWI